MVDCCAFEGFAIPPELDPDIPSRRESNLSQADLDADQDYEDGHAEPVGAGQGVPPAPPATPGTPARSQRAAASESPGRSVEDKAAISLDHARLVSALGALAECGDEEERGDDVETGIELAAAPASGSSFVVDESVRREASDVRAEPRQAVDGWVLAGMALSFAVIASALLLRTRP